MFPDNPYDNFSVAAVSDESNEVVGHIPKEISRLCALFLDHGGTIEGIVTGSRRYSREAGGMEIPCELTFTGKPKKTSKLYKLICELNSSFIYPLQ